MRKKVVDTTDVKPEQVKDTTDFSEIVDEYARVKQEADFWNKKVDSLKEKIKERLMSCEDLSFSTANNRVYLSTRNSVSMDEEGLIIRLKELDITDPIKTREYIDGRTLEDAMRRGELPVTEVAPYMGQKTTYNLMLSRGKK